jgi:hypothetical protein
MRSRDFVLLVLVVGACKEGGVLESGTDSATSGIDATESASAPTDPTGGMTEGMEGTATTGACVQLSDPCADDGECCSMFCDPQTSTCANLPGSGSADCLGDGEGCVAAAQCCSLACHGELCGGEICSSQGEACEANSDCCANACENGLCVVPGSCLPSGENCEMGGAEACCSNNCLDWGFGLRCGDGGVCQSEGEVCLENGDCCNKTCENGYCRSLGECRIIGEGCKESTECCSHLCFDDGTGYESCGALGGCLPFGELCHGDAECCNDVVNGGPGVCSIFNEEEGVGVCNNPGGCAPAGELCEPNTNECCPGMPEGAMYCLPTLSDVLRCWGNDGDCMPTDGMCTNDDDCCFGVCTDGACEDVPCFDDGHGCAFGDQCCSGVCLPDPETGELVCDSDCAQDDGSCTTNSDCCGGYCNPELMQCAPPPGECVPFLGPCETTAECCEGLTCEGGVCIVFTP